MRLKHDTNEKIRRPVLPAELHIKVIQHKSHSGAILTFIFSLFSSFFAAKCKISLVENHLSRFKYSVKTFDRFLYWSVGSKTSHHFLYLIPGACLDQ